MRSAPQIETRPDTRLPALTSLPGVGPARAARLAKLGVTTMRELLLLAPRKLEEWHGAVSIAEARRCGVDATIRGRVTKRSFVRLGGRRSLLRLELTDESGAIEVRFFNQPWLREKLALGAELEVHGRARTARTAQAPTFIAQRLSTEASPLPSSGALVASYPGTEGLAPEFLRGLCRVAAQRHAASLCEPLPRALLDERGLPPLADAVRALHEPLSLATFEAARRRVALEPILALQAALLERKSERATARALPVRIEDALHAEMLARLPFAPTRGQAHAIAEIRADLARAAPMRRLLQGDVGAGKTLVGIYACLAVAARGGQSAFLAPTEVLAEQHFDGSAPLLERAGLRARLFTGSLSAAERRDASAEIANGAAQVAFGTHALFGEDVRFARLALAVIDEQHRFGVAQRQRLLDKGRDVHGLLMTATPIPRSLALTLYGDLELTLLEGRPPGRGSVETHWLRGPERRTLLARLDERLSAGEQAYWVVPRIEDAQGDAAAVDTRERASGAAGAEARFAMLGRHALARHGIELVHGRVPARERARRLARFRSGAARLLVATTVIEVGVDVPAASVIVIEAAERLGLAQLHQLRGRVGRGSARSSCYLLGSSAAAERFELLETTSDGFVIAEADLRRRGMGDLAGLRQAGLNAEGLGDPERDLDLVLFARARLAADPELALRVQEESGAAARRSSGL